MKAISATEKRSLVIDIGLIFSFTLLMVLSAHIRIPLFFTPVPFTLQTLVVYLSLILLKHKACFSQVLYILLGIGGLPIFANGGAGWLYFLGPTGGYLFGFLVAALVFPYFLPRKPHLLKTLSFFAGAGLLIYTLGISWLMLVHHFTFAQSLIAGVYPFIPGAIVKIVVASLVLVRFNK